MADRTNITRGISDIVSRGALFFAEWLSRQGLSDTAIAGMIGEKYPSANPDSVNELIGLLRQGEQSASEIAALPPGFTNPPTPIPAIPGAAIGGYILDTIAGETEDGEPQAIRQRIDTDRPLSIEEIRALASEELLKIIDTDIDRWTERGVTFSQLLEIDIQLAWLKSPAVQEFLANPPEEML